MHLLSNLDNQHYFCNEARCHSMDPTEESTGEDAILELNKCIPQLTTHLGQWNSGEGRSGHWCLPCCGRYMESLEGNATTSRYNHPQAELHWTCHTEVYKDCKGIPKANHRRWIGHYATAHNQPSYMHVIQHMALGQGLKQRGRCGASRCLCWLPPSCNLLRGLESMCEDIMYIKIEMYCIVLCTGCNTSWHVH